MAYAQTDLKRLVAYTSVSHMGFVLLGVFAWNTLALQGVVLQLVCHALSTGALFILVGGLQDRIHTRDMTRMGGLWQVAPRMGGTAMFFALASLGLPGLGNFVAEFLILVGVWRVSEWAAVLGAVGLVFATVYALWMMQRAFQGEETHGLRFDDLGARETGMFAAMIAALVLIGFWPQPLIVTARQSVTALEQRHGERATLDAPADAAARRGTTDGAGSVTWGDLVTLSPLVGSHRGRGDRHARRRLPALARRSRCAHARRARGDASPPCSSPRPVPRSQVTPLLGVDAYALFITGLLVVATAAVALLSWGYLQRRRVPPEEYYVLLLTATLGGATLAASTHFASFFLGLEILSVSLYALIVYPVHRRESVEAAVKYLVLAGATSAFLIFGMALVYAETGIDVVARASRRSSSDALAGSGLVVAVGVVLILVGVGFKLAVVPFHMWTPDVYQGAPAPGDGLRGDGVQGRDGRAAAALLRPAQPRPRRRRCSSRSPASPSPRWSSATCWRCARTT